MRNKFIFLIVFNSTFSLISQNFIWAKQIAASLATSRSIAVDAVGNVYTTGKFIGTVDFDPNAGVFNLTSAGAGSDIFISKTDVSGNFVWAKRMGGSTNIAESASILLDGSGNIFITGNFAGTTNFDTGMGTNTITSSGINDIFICKLSPSGNLIWVKSMGGSSADLGQSTTLDGSGNIYTTGTFKGTADFDPSPSIYTITSAGLEDVFISKLDASGNFVWAKSIEGNSTDNGNTISIDPSGNICTMGYFDGVADFDPSVGTYTLANFSSGYSTYILKLDLSGNFIWAKAFGAGGGAVATAMALDIPGNIYLSGAFGGTVDFDPSPTMFNLVSSNVDIFVSKLDISGNLIFAKKMGGNSQDFASSIFLDGSSNIYTTGYFMGTADFDPSLAGSFLLSSLGAHDVFISKLDQSGNFIAAKAIGGSGNDEGNSIVLDGLGSLYISGSFSSTVDFDPDAGVYNLTATNNQEAFILKLNQNLITEIKVLLNNEKKIRIFPNPVEDKFTFELEQNIVNKITITNCLGQIVFLLNDPLSKQEIDLSFLEKGVYFLTAHSISQNIALKVLKE